MERYLSLSLEIGVNIPQIKNIYIYISILDHLIALLVFTLLHSFQMVLCSILHFESDLQNLDSENL